MITSNTHRILALDIGEKRVGVAQADTDSRVPFPVGTIDVDTLEHERLREIIAEISPALIVVGYPRNQSGEPTAQTAYVVEVAHKLEYFGLPIEFQDESLTSVLAEEYLKNSKKPYTKADIDAHAAMIILGDYLEAHYGH